MIKKLHQFSSYPSKRMVARTKKTKLKATLFSLPFIIGIHPISAEEIRESALHRIKSLLDEKACRTPAHKKINSQILYASEMLKGKRLTPDMDLLQVSVDGRIKVNLDASFTPQLLNDFEALSCEIIFPSEKFRDIVTNISLDNAEQVPRLDAIKYIIN